MLADSAHRAAVLLGHNVRLRLRDPGPVLAYLVMPMVLMPLLRPLHEAAMPQTGGGQGGETQAVLGMMVLFSALSLSVVGTATYSERAWRTWERLRATPASPAEMLLGKAAPVWALLVLQQGVLLTYGITVVGLPVPGPLVLLAVGVWGFALLALGTAVAVLVRSHGELAAACDIIALAVFALGGALVPLALLPTWMQGAAVVSPGYWAMTLFTGAVEGDTSATLTAAGIVAAFGLAAAAVACLRIARDLPEPQR